MHSVHLCTTLPLPREMVLFQALQKWRKKNALTAGLTQSFLDQRRSEPKKRLAHKSFVFPKLNDCQKSFPEEKSSVRKKKLFWTELFLLENFFDNHFFFWKNKTFVSETFLAHFDVGQEKDWVRISFNQSFPLFTGKQKYLNLAYYMFWNKLKYTIQYIQIIAVSVFLFVDKAMTDEHSQLFFFLFTLFASSSCFFHFDELNSWWYKFQQSLKVKTLIQLVRVQKTVKARFTPIMM